MVERRHVMSGGLVAGLTALMGESSAGAAAADDGALVSGAIDQLRRTFEQQFEASYATQWRGVSRIRQQQRSWIRSTQKFPDFIEIGLEVWDNLYDWHVANQQPVNMTRRPDGRYVMVFMFTTLLLRPEQAPDYVGFPFDSESQRTR